MPAPNHTPNSIYGYAITVTIAAFFMGISLGTRYWLETEYQGDSTGHQGLFKICKDDGDCYTMEEVPSVIETARAMCLCAILLYGLTMLIMGYLVFVLKMVIQSKSMGWLMMWICFLASLFAVIGPSHYIAKIGVPDLFGDLQWTFGYSLFMSYVSAFFGIWAGIFAIIAVGSVLRMQIPAGQISPAVAVPAPIMQVAYTHPTVVAQYPMVQVQVQHAQGYGNQPFVVSPNQPMYNAQAFPPSQAMPDTGVFKQPPPPYSTAAQ